MSETESSNSVELFITNDALEANRISMIVPQFEQPCTNGKIFDWEPFNDSLPYLHMHLNHLAYSISSDSFTSGPSCDICICTHENGCYRALDNNNFQVDFIPYCLDNECHMYGIVHSFPLDTKKTFMNDLNQTYNAPLPYLTNLGPQSEYLKVVSVGCGGCGTVKEDKLCAQQVSIYNGASASLSTCDTNTYAYEWIFYLSLTPIPLLILYIFVLYIFHTSPKFTDMIIYKLMVLHGISNVFYFIISIIDNFGLIHFLGGYLFVPLFAMSYNGCFFIDWTMFLLALNRWDILGGLKLFPDLNRSKFVKVAMILVISNSVLHVIIRLIPGFRVFAFVAPASYCNPGIVLVYEVYAHLFFKMIFYESELTLALSFLLYVWCTISIFYELFKHNISSKKEVLLFLQTLIPCLLIMLNNFAISFMTSTPAWFFIASPVFLQFECVHYPVLYLCLNKNLRGEFKIYMKKLIKKITGKDLTTTTTMPTSSSVFVNNWRFQS